jgi:hypothetical protein
VEDDVVVAEQGAHDPEILGGALGRSVERFCGGDGVGPFDEAVGGARENGGAGGIFQKIRAGAGGR